MFLDDAFSIQRRNRRLAVRALPGDARGTTRSPAGAAGDQTRTLARIGPRRVEIQADDDGRLAFETGVMGSQGALQPMPSVWASLRQDQWVEPSRGLRRVALSIRARSLTVSLEGA